MNLTEHHDKHPEKRRDQPESVGWRVVDGLYRWQETVFLFLAGVTLVMTGYGW